MYYCTYDGDNNINNVSACDNDKKNNNRFEPFILVALSKQRRIEYVFFVVYMNITINITFHCWPTL